MSAPVNGTERDLLAYLDGYTDLVNIEGGTQGGEFLIRPQDDLDGRFRAWGVDWQEWTVVTGCNVIIERVTA